MNITIPILAITPHGGNRVLVELANYLTEQGHEVTLLSTSENNSPFIMNDNVKLKVIFGFLKNKHVKFLLFIFFSHLFMKDGTIIANHFLTAYSAKLSRFFFKTKSVFFVQGIESECFDDYPKFISFFMRIINKNAFNFGNVISANPFLSLKLKEMKVDIAYEFNLGVSKKWILKSKCKHEYDVVYFARPEHNKGIDRFYEILSKNRDISFLCISQDENILRTLSLENNVDVRKPSNDLELYNCLDISKVLLLTSYFEGFSLPPLEGMARGLPLIYFECGGPSVYSNKKNSILISHSSSFNISYSLILNDYEKFSNEAFSTAKKFEVEGAFHELHDFISSL